MTILILPGALLLGVLSWALGGAALFGRGRGLSTLSLSCCALALLLACVDFVQQVREGDWSALMDTSDATLFAAAAAPSFRAVSSPTLTPLPHWYS